jgi:4-hydroxy-4-methyl-2-oxoglutarate aldolase
MHENILTDNDISALRELDTCMVSNAIEKFDVRLRNTGFANASVQCMFADLPPMVGYATTARLRSDDPPIDGRPPLDHSDWWKSILEVPPPRIVVLEDMDKPPGRGAFIGDVHAAILHALGCVGVVTDGAVRELPRIRETGFNVFAGSVAVSHSYAHIFHFGYPVRVGGLQVQPGDLLHGDQHGVLKIPKPIAAQVPAVARKLRQKEDKLIAACRSGEISVNELREVIKVLE